MLFPNKKCYADIGNFIFSSNSNISDGMVILREGEDAIIEFTIDANPVNLPILSKDGVEDVDMVLISENSIQFVQVLREDAGVYTISMTNEAGTAAENFTVVVECKFQLCSKQAS